MPRIRHAKKDLEKYERYTVSASFGAGPLRSRAILERSYGARSCCGMLDDLNGGRCKFCLWMENDREANEKWD